MGLLDKSQTNLPPLVLSEAHSQVRLVLVFSHIGCSIVNSPNSNSVSCLLVCAFDANPCSIAGLTTCKFPSHSCKYPSITKDSCRSSSPTPLCLHPRLCYTTLSVTLNVDPKYYIKTCHLQYLYILSSGPFSTTSTRIISPLLQALLNFFSQWIIIFIHEFHVYFHSLPYSSSPQTSKDSQVVLAGVPVSHLHLEPTRHSLWTSLLLRSPEKISLSLLLTLSLSPFLFFKHLH